jgi:alkanesulfonate monooxygenase SsuD/methylene tetrahydromethanopterin reductase-like flavin-dependent oxidoreductase (luciferase family)
MRVGVGLPNTTPGISGAGLVDWAKHAEALGFSTLATIGRLVFPGYEEIQALTAAAAVTDRIGLLTNVLIGPTYDPAMLAKMAAGLDQISGGRFVLGMATGWRDEDYVVAGREYRGRGKRFDADIELMLRAWRGEILDGATKRLTPTPTNGESVPMAFGGTAPAGFARAARHGVGWTGGGAGPDEMSGFNDSARAAWSAAGRDGSPKLWALTYYGMGSDARATAAAYLTDYYGEWGESMAAGMPADADGVRAVIAGFEAAGTGELLFVPTSPDLAELDRLAEAIGEVNPA